jgi:hypothetical protein
MPKKGYKQTEEHRLKCIRNLNKIPWNKGLKGKYKMSDEARKHQSESAKKRFTGENGLINRKKMRNSHTFVKGHKPSIESVDKQRMKMIGENSPRWKGGISYDPYNIHFKRIKNKIRERDNQVCMNCGIHREKLNMSLDVHHIDYNKDNSIEQNLISLCRRCHGITNINKKYWIDLFQEKLSKSYNYVYINIDIVKEN